MTKFYSPKSGAIRVAGEVHIVRKGIHEVPDILADSHEANEFGIKPVSEMTADEYRMLGLPVPAAQPDVLPETKAEPTEDVALKVAKKA